MMVVLQNECSLSGGDTKLLLAVKKIALSGIGNTKTLGAGMSAWVQASHSLQCQLSLLTSNI